MFFRSAFAILPVGYPMGRFGPVKRGELADFGFGRTTLTVVGPGDSISETIRLASATADLAQYESDFNRLRAQITELVSNGDTGYVSNKATTDAARIPSRSRRRR